MEFKLTPKEKLAFDLAKKAHINQKRKFIDKSYFDAHILPVFKLIKKIGGGDEELCCAALLHDVVEDTDITHDDIVRIFGITIANIVKEVTSDGDLVKLLGKPDYLLEKMLGMSDKALILKLCDRLQNLSDHFRSNVNFRKNYYKETRYIVKNLRDERILNKKQNTICNLIEGLLEMMEKRYRITIERNNFI